MFWRKRKQERPLQTTVRTKINRWIRWLQNQSVAFMQRKEAHWTQQQKKWYCVIFCLLAGGLSAGIIAHTFLAPVEAHMAFYHARQPVPRPLLIPREPERPWTTTDSLHVVRFRRWIDSLSRTPAGQHTLDSCWKERPGLLDSFLVFEKFIHSK